MPESTMICLDNSEWMRNGDYVPTRMESQHDAANLICGTKTQSNPENTVGVLTMAGLGPELLVSPTDDMSQILSSLHNVPIKGSTNFAQAVQIAQLALKHRRNKVGEQRIIIFVASPLKEEAKALVQVGKLLKKNNVAVDIISMGEIEENQEKLEGFINAANNTSDNSSHLVTIPAGMLPSDVLISSPIINGGMNMGGMGGAEGVGAAAGGGGGGGGDHFAEYGGIDPSMDPELAMALRVSMEEERARQEAASGASAASGPVTGGAGAGVEEAKVGDLMDVDAGGVAVAVPATPGAGAGTVGQSQEDADEEALLQQALAMSVQEDEEGDDAMDAEEYEAMKMALEMSLASDAATTTSSSTPPPVTPAPAARTTTPPPAPGGSTGSLPTSSGATAASAAAGEGQFFDPAFVQGLLGQLEGVDQNDPRVQAAIAQLGGGGGGDKKPEEKKDEGKDK